MLNFKLGEHNFQLATGWHELTIGQMIDLRRTTDVPLMLSILSGLDKTLWEQAVNAAIATNDISFQIFFAALQWMNVPCDFRKMKVPASNDIEISGKRHRIPTYKEFFASVKFIEKIHLNNTSQTEGDIIDAAPQIIAIAFYRAITGEKYDNEKLNEITAICRQCKVTEAFPVARFFLLKCFGSEEKKRSSATHRKTKSSAQGSTT